MKSLRDPIVGQFVNELKEKATPSEKLMMAKLDKVKAEYIFQYPIKNPTSFYIADFFLPQCGMILEIDGGYHTNQSQVIKDAERDRFLREKGYHVKHVNNEDVMTWNAYMVRKFRPYRMLSNNDPLLKIKAEVNNLSKKGKFLKKPYLKDFCTTHHLPYKQVVKIINK